MLVDSSSTLREGASRKIPVHALPIVSVALLTASLRESCVMSAGDDVNLNSHPAVFRNVHAILRGGTERIFCWSISYKHSLNKMGAGLVHE